eukprot:3912754-Rhodomonas_salina.2
MLVPALRPLGGRTGGAGMLLHASYALTLLQTASATPRAASDVDETVNDLKCLLKLGYAPTPLLGQALYSHRLPSYGFPMLSPAHRMLATSLEFWY